VIVVMKLIGKASLGLLVVVALAVVAGVGWREWRQHLGETRLEVRSPNGIDESLYVSVGDSEQWVTIRGQDRANPALLIVHGGPGVALSPLAPLFVAYERGYTVVQWDQRGTARTLARAGDDVPRELSIALLAADGVAVAEHIRARLGKPKILLLGLSWGSAVALEMARQRPDLFHAYVGTGLFVHRDESFAVAYDVMLERARAEGNQQAIDELGAIGPPPHETPEAARTQSKWAALLAGAPEPGAAAQQRFMQLLVAPRYGFADVVAYMNGYQLSDELIDLGSIDLRTSARKFELPLIVIQGAQDYLTPAELARRYFGELEAPHAEFVTIRGGHTALLDNPDEFLRALDEHVRPFAADDKSGL
jgi:pimeloyl-ACP methyl ester carboxylesterase